MIQIIKEIWSFDLNILTDKIIKEISTNKNQRKIFCTILTEKNLRLMKFSSELYNYNQLCNIE